MRSKDHRREQRILTAQRRGPPVQVRVLRTILFRGDAHYPSKIPIDMAKAEAEARAAKGEVELVTAPAPAPAPQPAPAPAPTAQPAPAPQPALAPSKGGKKPNR